MLIKLHVQPGETNAHKTTCPTRRLLPIKLHVQPVETNAHKPTCPTRRD